MQLVAEPIDEGRLGRVRHRNVESELGAAQRDREPLARVLLGERGDRVVLGDALAQIHDLEAELVGERRREVTLVEDPGVDQVLTEALAGPGLARECRLELSFREQLALDEDLAEALALLRNRRKPLDRLRRGNHRSFGRERPARRQLRFDLLTLTAVGRIVSWSPRSSSST